ncbi:MAG TPA: protein kinase, partial [Phototrophicaceae bacterium]|nr:protein kinase [Phototrophicaceae bacterium]
MSDQPMPDSQSGMSLDKRYQLIDKIGEGGMGVVFQARDRLTGQIVALKKVTVSGDQLQFASKSTDQDFRLSLAQEFRTMASLRHPNIVGVLDYGFDEQRQPYYTMQIIEGAKTITEYAIGQTTAHKIRLLIETLQALGYLHRRDIVHRDIKPANIMVTAGGTVQVMDFGLALHQTESFTNLHTGVVGTMAYIAPELFAEERATIRSDLYAVGLLAYEMFVGKYPFNSKNIAMMVNGILFEKPDTSSLDFELAKVLDRLIAKTPDQRYNSADETVIALCQATGQRTPGENTIQRESYLQAAKFVGRSQEIRQLKTALEQAVHGEGGAWLVGGESGAGKSRLLDELRTQALVAGALVLRGQAVAEGGLPYQIWREALRRLILATRLSDFEAGVLEVIVPDISSLLDREIAPVSRLDGQSEHKRLSMTIFEVFKRQTQPLVLILEDLHWLGDSIDLLQQLAQAAGEHPWLMIGSYRNDESPGLPNRLSGFKVLHLDRLNESAIADLSAAMLGDPGRKPEVIDLIKRETEGNAFFIVEVMRALAEDAGSLNEIGKSALPDTVYSRGVEEVVRRRLNRLPETVREWLKLAAVIGRQIDLNILNLTSRLFTEDLT